MLVSDSITKPETFSEQTNLRRGPLLITALLAAG